MELPISRTAFNRLGERLAASDDISDEDYALLERCLAAYDDVKDAVRSRLAELGYEASARTKTTSTLVDKLRREKGAKLANVQDIAGCRITVEGTRLDQDAVVARISEAFAEARRQPKVIDRRERPSFGYRAVHVVVFVDGLPVEIQIRTQLQNLWAQLTERLGDVWGRAIRYGGEADEPDTVVWGQVTRAHVVALVAALSELIASIEHAGEWLANLGPLERAFDDEVGAEYRAAREEQLRAAREMRSVLTYIALAVERLR
jgi:ppGpp synthetase/RelA/SpoT-type nucleotidyltranferase